MNTPIKPLSTYPELREKMRDLCKQYREARFDCDTPSAFLAASLLVDEVDSILDDEAFAEAHGTYEHDWRPIPTAPKDGSFFSAWCASLHESGFVAQVVAFYDAENEAFVVCRFENQDDLVLTHWTPLLPAPQAKPIEARS